MYFQSTDWIYEEIIQRRHVVIFVDELFESKNHLQIDTIKCYCLKKGLQLHICRLSKTEICKHNDVLFRRHCLLAEIMEKWKTETENDFSYVIDSDVIAPNYQGQK